MDSIAAFFRGEMARREGAEMKVFDWKKAAKYIKDNNVQDADAGLESDMSYTGGPIIENGIPVPREKSGTYLASVWATPILEVNGEEIEMWSWQHEVPDYDSATFWPQEALDILALKEV